jgi:hypothetical protein
LADEFVNVIAKGLTDITFIDAGNLRAIDNAPRVDSLLSSSVGERNR